MNKLSETKKPDYKLNTITFLLRDYGEGKVEFDYTTSGYDIAGKKTTKERSQAISALLSDTTVSYLSLLRRYGIKLEKAIEMQKLINKQLEEDFKNYQEKEGK